MLKPGKQDIKVNILIAGEELEELQKHTWSMAESFGLDDRIDNYKGKSRWGCIDGILRINSGDTIHN